MFGLFDLFGRGAAIRALDDALRASGLHPLMVPEAVKLTILKIRKRQERAQAAADHDSAARLLAYCLLGHAQFIENNGAEAAQQVEARFKDAIAAGDSDDARIILLALHAGLVAPEIADRVEIATT